LQWSVRLLDLQPKDFGINNEVITSKSDEGIMSKSIFMCWVGSRYWMCTNKAFYCRISCTFLLLLQVQVPHLKNPKACSARLYRWWSEYICWGGECFLLNNKCNIK
jgi:hypothetical protein